MLQQKQRKNDMINILNPLESDILNNSIWEYVTGLPSIYNLGTIEKHEHLVYNIDDIDIESMKLLIEQHKIDVNKFDSFGNQALYRICSIRYAYDKNSSNSQFEKQYQAIKLLLENDASIFKLHQHNGLLQDECRIWWRKLLILVKEKQISVSQVSLIQKYMSTIVFGDDNKYAVAQKLFKDVYHD